MAVSEQTSGSQTATLDTEHTLATISAAGVFILVVDTANMVNGDIMTLRLYTKCRSTDTSRMAFSATYAHVQAEPNKYSTPVPSNVELIATLEQTDGTGRAFPWSILNVG
jgi:hypothetical protein